MIKSKPVQTVFYDGKCRGVAELEGLSVYAVEMSDEKVDSAVSSRETKD
jgi:hypothetical protein